MSTGTYRPARSIQPGWHIRTFDENGAASWHEVTLVFQTCNPFTGEKFVRVVCADGVVSSCPVGDEAMCRTTVEARRAAKETTR